MKKTCTRCKAEKNIDEFPNDKNRQDGKYIYCKKCCNDRDKKQYHSNLEHSRSLKKNQSIKHKIRNNAISKTWYLNNKERTKKNVAIYKNSNPEWFKNYQKQWNSNNIEKMKVYHKKFFQTERGKKVISQQNHNRRARIRGAGGSHSLQEWEALKMFHNYKCIHCQKSEPEIKLTRDHIIPVSKGGNSFISNIQPLCQSCNSKKHNKYEY